MTAPTRTRRFRETPPPTDKPLIVQGASGDTTAAPAPRRSYVIRNTVERRSHDRRSGPRRDSDTRSITQPDPEELLELDATLRAYFENAIRSAGEDAYRNGHAEGRREALAASTEVANAITAATNELSHFSSTERQMATAAVIELAERFATEIINRTPHDDGAALLQRIRGLMDDLNDGPFTIAVHTDDLDVISAGLDGAAVTVAVDPQLQPGEARIRGTWSYNDFTNAAAWEAMKVALELDEDPTPLPPEGHQPV